MVIVKTFNENYATNYHVFIYERKTKQSKINVKNFMHINMWNNDSEVFMACSLLTTQQR